MFANNRIPAEFTDFTVSREVLPLFLEAYLKVETDLSAFDLIKQPGAKMKAETSHYLTPFA